MGKENYILPIRVFMKEILWIMKLVGLGNMFGVMVKFIREVG